MVFFLRVVFFCFTRYNKFPMSKIPFRTHHLMQIMQLYQAGSGPLDRLLYRYLREVKSIGAADRRQIAAKAYHYIKNARLIEALTTPPVTLEKLLATAEQLPSDEALNAMQLSLPVRYSVPDRLWELLVAAYGEPQAIQIADAWNGEAPTTIRTNLAKISRAALLERLSAFDAIACTQALGGITFPKRLPLFGLPEFAEGLFEMQDEASQLVSELMEVQPGDQVMDYCAGSGGKTLAFAHRMQGKGQIYLHDVRPSALIEAKERLRRAGVQNCQWLCSDSPHLKKLHQKMDWVLVDAPCSGTGTFRRNPDMKQDFTLENLKSVCALQRVIFEKALSTLKPGGHIVYATCSILPEENENQVAHLLKTYPLTLLEKRVQTVPTLGGMDGFFAVVLQKVLSTPSVSQGKKNLKTKKHVSRECS